LRTNIQSTHQSQTPSRETGSEVISYDCLRLGIAPLGKSAVEIVKRPSHRTWQRDAELGANTLIIANGHTVDAMRFVTGDFSRLSAVVATQAKQWLDTGTNTLLDVTSPDSG